ncbi:MAG: ROK family protein [Dehalococcoidia bacterium]|nr:ROK family protein [Dehalococcoidia bacterium]MCB9486958.1 ROK family protein [Thermoflexaceae bacterium]
MTSPIALGIDIGGSGIKLALVNTETGALATSRRRIDTPRPATPNAVSGALRKLASQEPGIRASAPVGIGFPGVIRGGKAQTAANLGKAWIGTDVRTLGDVAAGRAATVVNDADAAGLAEVRFGAGRGQQGLVAIITLGTGIGSALVYAGHLLPNSELGHIEIRGKDAEKRAAASVRVRKGLSWKAWSRRVEEYLLTLDRLVSPDLVIIGGGISRNADKFLPRIHVRPRVVPASLGNDAGIIGAALWARDAADVEGDE